MEARGSSEASSVVLILTRVLVNYLAAVWGEKKGGGKGGENTGNTLFPQSLHRRLLPLEQNPLFSALINSSLPFPLLSIRGAPTALVEHCCCC